MRDNLKMIREAKALVKSASSEHCATYNDLCSGMFGEAVMSVLDGELRMAKKLSELEGNFTNDDMKIYAGQAEINEFIEHES